MNIEDFNADIEIEWDSFNKHLASYDGESEEVIWLNWNSFKDVAYDFYILGKQSKEPVSEDLEQAAEEYADESCFDDPEFTATKLAFIAGAEWKKEQMPMSEDTVLFQKGVEEGRRLEKDDLALTWEDMATIDSLITEVSNSYAVGNYDHDGEREHFYGEVLRRFKETKDGQVHQATEE